MFTRQHYKAIAEVLAANKPKSPMYYEFSTVQIVRQVRCDHHRCIVDQLANLFVQDNSQFDWDRFLKACGEI